MRRAPLPRTSSRRDFSPLAAQIHSPRVWRLYHLPAPSRPSLAFPSMPPYCTFPGLYFANLPLKCLKYRPILIGPYARRSLHHARARLRVSVPFVQLLCCHYWASFARPIPTPSFLGSVSQANSTLSLLGFVSWTNSSTVFTRYPISQTQSCLYASICHESMVMIPSLIEPESTTSNEAYTAHD